MAYNHKEYIDMFLDIHDDDERQELDEVYRKAETFDQLAYTYEQYKDSHTHDLKSTMGIKAIELLEADE